jgi:hypothetical protein
MMSYGQSETPNLDTVEFTSTRNSIAFAKDYLASAHASAFASFSD